MGEITINPIHNVHKKYRTMNFVNPYIFAPPVDLSTNTEIGGVASTISTPDLLATKLGIDVSRITNFAIVGSDIKCKITGSYAIPANAFLFNNTPCTYYRDSDSLVTSIGANCFYSYNALDSINRTFQFKNATTVYSDAFFRSNAEYIYLDNAITIGSNAFAGMEYFLKLIYIPRATSLGGSVLDNYVFNSYTGNSYTEKPKIYCHPSLATNNGGAPDGDIAYAISKGATVVYVTSFASPNVITTLAAGTIYSTAVQLNFTPPSSTNAIDYYECYANGVLKNKILASGEYITGLTASTSYNITLIAVDVFCNKSIVSNSVTQSTNTTNAVPITGLVSYYKLESNSNDSYGSNNGIDTSVSYVSGKVSNAASYNGSSSYTTIADSSSLSFTNGTNDLPFSVSFWVKLTATGIQFFVSKASGGFSTNAAEWSIYNNSGAINVFLANKTTGYISNQFASNLRVGFWYHLVITYSGSGTNAGMKLYKNSIKVDSYTTGNSGSYTSMSNTASTMNFGQEKAGGGTYKLNGLLDEISIYNNALTQKEIDLLYNNGVGITL